MAFDNMKQLAIDENGNVHYSDPLFYLLNLDKPYDIPAIYASYLTQQSKLEAVINEKYTRAMSVEPKGVGMGAILPIELNAKYIHGVPAPPQYRQMPMPTSMPMRNPSRNASMLVMDVPKLFDSVAVGLGFGSTIVCSRLAV